MNDLLNDIEKLQRVETVIRRLPYCIDVATSLHFLREIIFEKKRIVDNFENFKQYILESTCCIMPLWIKRFNKTKTKDSW